MNNRKNRQRVLIGKTLHLAQRAGVDSHAYRGQIKNQDRAILNHTI